MSKIAEIKLNLFMCTNTYRKQCKSNGKSNCDN